MKAVAVNGSARKNGNTAQVLEKVLEGIAAKGIETELVSLFDYNIGSCRSCLACQRRDNLGKGVCMIQDDYQKVEAKLKEADIVIFGSPIYSFDTTGQFRCFFERLTYSTRYYEEPRRSLWPKTVPSAFVYTMGGPEDSESGEQIKASLQENVIWMQKRLFKYPPEVLAVGGSRVFKTMEPYYAPCFEGVDWLHYGPTEEQVQQALALGEKLVKNLEEVKNAK